MTRSHALDEWAELPIQEVSLVPTWNFQEERRQLQKHEGGFELLGFSLIIVPEFKKSNINWFWHLLWNCS